MPARRYARRASPAVRRRAPRRSCRAKGLRPRAPRAACRRAGTRRPRWNRPAGRTPARRGTAAIIVVRMDQDGALGHSRGAGAQSCEQQPAFEYLFHCGMLFFEFDNGHHGGMVGDITATERIGQHLVKVGGDAVAHEDVVEQRAFGLSICPKSEKLHSVPDLRAATCFTSCSTPSFCTCATTDEPGSELKSPVRITGRSPRSASMRS